MKILFSPSEAKSSISTYNKLDISLFTESNFKREEIVNLYMKYIDLANNEELKKLFGVKDIKNLKKEILNSKYEKAINRYDGVAYKYLNYESLNNTQQKYIDVNTIIFSNLYGAILAKDKISFYKLKQGEKLNNLDIGKFYKKEFSKVLDKFLEDEDILDLRANFYEKFYTIKKKYLTMKFIKNSKVVSHFAKAYRGKILREIAINGVNSIDEILNINFEGVQFLEIREIKNRKELIFEVE